MTFLMASVFSRHPSMSKDTRESCAIAPHPKFTSCIHGQGRRFVSELTRVAFVTFWVVIKHAVVRSVPTHFALGTSINDVSSIFRFYEGVPTLVCSRFLWLNDPFEEMWFLGPTSGMGHGTGKSLILSLFSENCIRVQNWKFFLFLFFVKVILSRDCPRIFAPALVPGQRDSRTRKYFCPGTKGQQDVPSQIVPGRPVPWKP